MKINNWPTVSTERIRLLGCHVDRQLYQIGQWVPIIIISFQAPQTVSANTSRHVLKNHRLQLSTLAALPPISKVGASSCRTRKPVEQCRTSRTSPRRSQQSRQRRNRKKSRIYNVVFGSISSGRKDLPCIVDGVRRKLLDLNLALR